MSPHYLLARLLRESNPRLLIISWLISCKTKPLFGIRTPRMKTAAFEPLSYAPIAWTTGREACLYICPALFIMHFLRWTVRTLQVSHCQCETCASGRGASGAVQRQLQPVAPCATWRITSKAQPRAQDKVVYLFIFRNCPPDSRAGWP